MKTSCRSDRRVKPTQHEYRILTNDECRALGSNGHSHVNILDRYGKIAQVKVTSVKTWKTRADIEVNCKYGLYEFFTVRMTPENPNTELIEVLD